jgi:L-threonylcarbamoyladenylate synthase
MATREEVLRGAELIRAGGLVAFPTETVYGLGANALDPKAVARIFAAKGRPFTSPLIVHVSSAAMAREVVSEWPSAAEVLAHTFWPGPLTLVLPRSAQIPDIVTGGLGTVGVRVPSHPVALEFIEAAGVPVAGPSANLFTHLSPTTAEHVRRGLGTLVDLVLDGGSSEVGIESTVLSLAEGPVLLRPGMVSQARIEALIGPIQTGGAGGEGPHAAPGLHERHYSPKTKLVLEGRATDSSIWLYWREQGNNAHSVRMPDDPGEYARRLYQILHQLDEQGWEAISVEPVPESSEWEGIRDRLRRAASKRER